MPYRIRVEKELKFIYVSYAGYVSLNNRMDALTELFVEYSEVVNDFNYLFDVRQLENVLKPIEQEIFGQYIASRAEFKNAKQAILKRAEQRINEELMNIASGGGMVYKVFTSEPEAISWLIEGDDL